MLDIGSMVRPDDRPLILLNAAHALTGGALTYLQNIVRELERYPDFRWILLAPKQTLEDIKIPSSWMVIARPPQSFFALHMWEQVVLPMLARRRGVSAVLCNAECRLLPQARYRSSTHRPPTGWHRPRRGPHDFIGARYSW